MKTVEDIVKNKEYYELTNEEKLIVGDVAQSETEFNELKYLLLGSSTFFAERKVHASDNMRAHIMEKLYPPTAASITWYQSVLAFLFPPKKQFYQYPAFQLASVLVLFLGIFTMWKSPFKNQELAQNDMLIKKEVVIEEPSSIVESDLAPSAPENILTEDVEESNEQLPVLEPEIPETIKLDVRDDAGYNSTSTIGESSTANGDFSHSKLDIEKDKYFVAPTNSKEVLEEESAVVVAELDDIVSVEELSNKSLDSEVMAPSRLEKKESRLTLPVVSSGNSDIFREKAKVTALNITEIKGLQSLFFEVK